MKVPCCPVCRSNRTQLGWSGIYDDRYGFPGHFDLRLCPACGHRFLDATFTPAELGRLYTEFYPRASLDLANWQPARELSRIRLWFGRERSSVFRWVPRSVKVLDVGCGFGESLGYHRARGCEVRGVEADENIRRVAERFGFEVKVGVFRAGDFPPNSFDFVTLDQVIEHAADPVGLLRDAAAVLRPGGTMLLSTPNGASLTAAMLGRRWVHWHAPYHLQLFSRQSLATAARVAGLRMLWCRHITNPRWYHFQWLHLLARPAAGVPSVFWAAGRPWPKSRWVSRKLASGLNWIGVNHALAFFLDGLAQGDNLVAAFERPSE